MLSRVAENVFWMSRYVERAENLARLLDVGFDLELEGSGLLTEVDRGPLDGVLTILGAKEAYDLACPVHTPDALMRFLTFERAVPYSILGIISIARENARGTQDAVSAEAWSQLNQLYLYLTSPKALRRFDSSPTRLFGIVRRACILWDGLVDSTLPRNEVFHFLQLGRYLERVDQLTRIIGARAHTLDEAEAAYSFAPQMSIVHWTTLLRSCSAYEAFLSTRGDALSPEGVVRYLVLDPDFPRSMRFSITQCRESISEIGGGDEDGYGSEAERLLGRLDGELRYIDVLEIFDRGVRRFLSSVQDTCDRVGEEIHKAYFAT
ncbi:MAG: alpha-E domain-containing protein [Isosphaeraceae bacterium]|nr:alpha-E domain-containing protein [Isosphaeraceae bacterium]